MVLSFIYFKLLRAYYMIRTFHGIYVHLFFYNGLLRIYIGLVWVFYYIPKPYLQIKGKEIYYEIDTGDYINIVKKD